MKIFDTFNDYNAQRTFNYQDVQNSKALVLVCYLFPILFFLPAVMNKNSYCRFHSNQCLSWFIVSAVLGIVEGILALIPILGVIISAIISLAMLAVTIILMIESYNGKAIRIPVIGSLIEVF